MKTQVKIVFVWEDGYSKVIDMGVIVNGLRHKGLRPIECYVEGWISSDKDREIIRNNYFSLVNGRIE